MSILEKINSHEDMLRLSEIQRIDLCREIRDFLVDHVSKTGGHLASNLGVVELTVALETVYDTRKDRLVFDGRILTICVNLAESQDFQSLQKVILMHLWQVMPPAPFPLRWVWPVPEPC